MNDEYGYDPCDDCIVDGDNIKYDSENDTFIDMCDDCPFNAWLWRDRE